MTYQRRIVRETDEPVYPAAPASQVVDQTTVVGPSGGEIARRVIVLIFGLIQLLIALRIILLLLDARQGNDIVRSILDVSQVFVAPFIGIFNVDALHANGSVLDIAAIAALVGWTVLEAIALWIVNLFRREPTVV